MNLTTDLSFQHTLEMRSETFPDIIKCDNQTHFNFTSKLLYL